MEYNTKLNLLFFGGVGFAFLIAFCMWAYYLKPLTSKTNDNLEPLITVEQDFDNSLIQLTNDTGLEMVHADDERKQEIIEHTEYDEKNPVYLINIPFGQNIRFLRNKIKNDNIRIYCYDQDTEPEDNEVVRSGMRIVAKNGSIVTDTIIVIVVNDIDGTGTRNRRSKSIMETMAKCPGKYEVWKRLSADINGDEQLTNEDVVAYKELFK